MRWVLLVVCAACSFPGQGARDGGDDPTGDGPRPDAIPDAIPGDAPAACVGWTPHHFDPCAIPAPTPDDWVMDGAHTYDTGTDLLDGTPITDTIGAGRSTVIDQGTNQPARLLSVQRFTLMAGATLRVIGDKPLIVASWSGITIEGTINASSGGGTSGAGANPAECATNGASPGVEDDDTGGGSGGGGGGAFQGNGGDGGPGDNPTTVAGGAGGDAVGPPTIVRGGCAGADGGNAHNTSTHAAGGPAGGAIQLSARGMIRVLGAGRVVAGGGGGGGAPSTTAVGGGGGGAGGYIGLDSPMEVIVDGRLVANGGGGGASSTFGGTGDPGDDAGEDETQAVGGAQVGTCATAGGLGAAGATLDGATVTGTVSCGGGGGGGGAGYVLVWAAPYTPGASPIVSPPATVNP